MSTTDNQGEGSAPNAEAAAAAAAAAAKGTGAAAGGEGDKGGAAAAAKPAAGEGGTVATGAEGDAKGAPQVFPDNWRKELAGDDAKELARLERMSSPKDLFKSYRELEAKVSSGALKAVVKLPDNPTADQLTEYRKANGIPESHDKYDTALASGLVIGDADKPIVDEYLKYAHSKNYSPAQVKENLEWYYGTLKAQQQARDEMDSTFKLESVATMKGEWGGEYNLNVNRIKAFLKDFDQNDVNRWLGGYTADGRVAGDDPGILRILDKLAREADPAGVVVPGSSNPAASIATELNNLTKLMGNKNSEYWKGPKAAENQQRYRDLVEANEKVKGKVA